MLSFFSDNRYDTDIHITTVVIPIWYDNLYVFDNRYIVILSHSSVTNRREELHGPSSTARSLSLWYTTDDGEDEVPHKEGCSMELDTRDRQRIRNSKEDPVITCLCQTLRHRPGERTGGRRIESRHGLCPATKTTRKMEKVRHLSKILEVYGQNCKGLTEPTKRGN